MNINEKIKQMSDETLITLSEELTRSTIDSDGEINHVLRESDLKLSISALATTVIGVLVAVELGIRMKHLKNKIATNVEYGRTLTDRLINPKDEREIANALIELSVSDIRDLQVYLEQTYGVYMVLQANKMPDSNDKLIIGYANANGSNPDIM
jgi:hypothetical protein